MANTYFGPDVPEYHVGTPSYEMTEKYKKEFAGALQPYYQKYLGREADLQRDIYPYYQDFQKKWGGDYGNIENFIKNSAEAKAYAAKQAAAPPTTAAAGGGAWSSGSGQSFKDWFMGQVTGKPWEQKTLDELEALLGQSGSKITPANAAGERTKIWDPVQKDWVRVGFGEGSPVWIYQNWGESGSGAGGGGGGGTGGISVNSPLLSPWTKAFTPPTSGTGTPGELPHAPGFDFREFDAPSPFVAPKGEEVFEDPGYLFRKQQAEEGFENSAAARGVLRSGGNIKDFLKYGQDLASQEYEKVYNRRLGEYKMGWENALKDWESDLSLAEKEYAPGLLDWQVRVKDIRDLQDKAYDRAWREYEAERDAYYRNQQNIYDRLYGGANLGRYGFEPLGSA